MMRAVLALVAVGLVAGATADPALCVGYDGIDSNCALRTTEASCLATTAGADSAYKGSCAWHKRWGSRTTEKQRLTSKGGALTTTGYAFASGECAVRIFVSIPADADWGAYYKVLGGPGNITDSQSWQYPEFPLAGAACTLGLGAPSSCSLSLVPPGGFASDPAFNGFSDLLEFFTRDRGQISALSGGGRLPADDSFFVDMELEYLDCTTADGGGPWPATGAKDSFVLGGSPYLTTFYDTPPQDTYSVLTYRAYPVRNATEARWDVSVAKSFRSSGSKSALDVMLLRDADYLAWVNACTTQCPAPTPGLALTGSYCRGTTCSGRKAGLGASGTYWLVVAYPKVSSPYWEGSYSSSQLSFDAFAKQLVKVSLAPTYRL